MRLYLSSYGLGDETSRLQEMVAVRGRGAIIMNAVDNAADTWRADFYRREVEALSRLGIRGQAFDLRDFFERPGDVGDALKTFDLVWATGGNSFLLRQAMRLSGADVAIPSLVRENRIVYGGYSAGAVAATPTLRGAEIVDDPTAHANGYRGGVVWEGLGLVPYSIAPHYRSDHPESERIERVVDYFEKHHMPYRALRDGEVIVVNDS